MATKFKVNDRVQLKDYVGHPGFMKVNGIGTITAVTPKGYSIDFGDHAKRSGFQDNELKLVERPA
jgi:hypothetical protein